MISLKGFSTHEKTNYYSNSSNFNTFGILFFHNKKLKSCQIDAFINWHIYLPGVKEEKVIYDSFFRDGDTISVLTISDFNSLKKIKKINNFEAISSENIRTIQNNLLNFYNGLGQFKGIDGKEAYNQNINTEQLLSTNNYFLMKKKNQNKSYILLILDTEDKKIYSFIRII